MRALPRTQHAGRRLFADPAPPGNTAHQRADDGAADGGATHQPERRTYARYDWPRPRAKRCQPSCTHDGWKPLGSNCWTVWGPQRCGTSSSRTGRETLCPGLWVVSSMASRQTLRRRWPGGRDGEVGALWVKGDSRAIGYWQGTTTPCRHFAASGMYPATCSGKMPMAPMCTRGRSDDMLKVSGSGCLQ